MRWYTLTHVCAADRETLIHAVSLLKRNAMAAPFERAFREQAELEQKYEPGSAHPSGELLSLHYRADESMYILPAHDRVTVVISTRFEEEADRIFGKVFLQEFVDARRQPSIQNAPQVLYSNREPPLEVRGVVPASVSENTGYVTFVLFPRHFQHPDVRATTISHIQLFRIDCTPPSRHAVLTPTPFSFCTTTSSQVLEGIHAQPHALSRCRISQSFEPCKA